jgi:hypothetical protein
MSLQVLLLLVVGGIAGIAILLHIMGLTEPRRFKDGSDALAAWAREVPEQVPSELHLSSDNRAALILLDNGFGIVWCHGDDTVARHIPVLQPQKTKRGLRFSFPDFGASALDVHLDAPEQARWLQMLRPQND